MTPATDPILHHDQIVDALLAHPDVADAAFVLVPDPEAGTGAEPVTLVVAAPASFLSGPELRLYLAEHNVPATGTIAFVDAVARDSEGRADARAAEVAIRQRYRFQPPTPGTEETLAAIWAEVLGAGPIGATDDFVDLGGDSLALIDLATRLSAQLDVTLTMQELLGASTVRELATMVEGHCGAVMADGMDR